ncbi:MAG: rhomboid family intramembrane serine protease [Candidatus Hadarchaeum sp.]|uniref:rhomboid family intramembrane serine protease n=1 Tax=Candidatus Hadarchaeum sp. TaxID=2883567 RepID=UPI003D0BA7EE
MFPLKDENPSSSFPYVNTALIVVNLAVFIITLLNGTFESTIEAYGMRPVEVLAGKRLETLFISLFLHGGVLHILGNMLYLYIFGDNVEDALGHGKYLAFYLGTGIIASLIHALSDPVSDIPTIGASGAISGVLGAYLVLYPRARVYTAVGIYLFWRIIMIPAIFFLGFWFLLQLLSASVTWLTGISEGVAYWAHIGGFIVGALLILPTRAKLRKRRKSSHYLYDGF